MYIAPPSISRTENVILAPRTTPAGSLSPRLTFFERLHPQRLAGNFFSRPAALGTVVSRWLPGRPVGWQHWSTGIFSDREVQRDMRTDEELLRDDYQNRALGSRFISKLYLFFYFPNPLCEFLPFKSLSLSHDKFNKVDF